MFRRCQGWRRELTRLADGLLPIARRGSLARHLSRCRACRTASEADEALHDVLTCHTGSLSAAASEAFDARVVAMVMAGNPPGSGRTRVRLWQLPRLSYEFFKQMAGGALVAASAAAVCLFPSVRPANLITPARTRAAQASASQSGIPSSIESLLVSPAPRAALLWSPTGIRRTVRPVGIFELAPRLTDLANTISHSRAPHPQQHGSVQRSTALS